MGAKADNASNRLRDSLVRLTAWSASAATGVLLLAGLLFFASCHPSKLQSKTVTYFRLGWSQPDDPPGFEPLSQQFTRETGIHLRSLPVPENTLDQLDLSRKLLQDGSAGPDVLNIDVIWPRILAPDLVDLRPYLADELSSLEPQLLPSYDVDGKLVAIPYTVQVGVLEYRSDLLREYGYQHPPRTWDELESMAARIQAGERAKGHKNFWGYVWQGAATEALTCNAIEWQASQGGGRIIESNRTISVNNPVAIRSWQRAKRWIGWISPPSVIAYQELDSINVFDKGEAAFGRVWGGGPITRAGLSRQLHWRTSLAQSKTGYASLPGGRFGWASTLGGSGLGISQYSSHRKEALELVRFLIRAQIRSNEADDSAVIDKTEIQPMPSDSNGSQNYENKIHNNSQLVIRPSIETGEQYERVTKAYIDAVHSVLTGEKSAPEAAAELEKILVQITGFQTGPAVRDY